MLESRFTHEPMVQIRQQAEGGPVPDVAKKHRVSEQTLCV